MWECKARNHTPVGIPGWDVTDGQKFFWADNKEDAEWLAEALDEITNTVVKLFCQNKACKGLGEYITRTAADAKKNMYICDTCGKPMTRKVAPLAPSVPMAPAPGMLAQPVATVPHPVASEEQKLAPGVVSGGGTATNQLRHLSGTVPALGQPVPLFQDVEELKQRIARLEISHSQAAETVQTILELVEGLAAKAKT